MTEIADRVAMASSLRTCETCLHWEIDRELEGFCRRYPPSRQTSPFYFIAWADTNKLAESFGVSEEEARDFARHHASPWPIVGYDEWCGEWSEFVQPKDTAP